MRELSVRLEAAMADALEQEVGIYWPAWNDNITSSRTGTGQATISMKDGATYVVAHSPSEIARKSAVPATTPGSSWVAFDLAQPTSRRNTIVLDISQIAGVA